MDFFVVIVYNYICKRKESPLHSLKQDEIISCVQLKRFHLYFERGLKLCKILTVLISINPKDRVTHFVLYFKRL